VLGVVNLGGRPPMVAFYGALAGAAFDNHRRPRLRLAPALLDDTTTRQFEQQS